MGDAMMRKLSAKGQKVLEDLSTKHGFSAEAVLSMLEALIAGQGQMAQFHHGEFGGSGQWMRGGMTMTSDMFNNALKSRIDSLCNDLCQAMSDDHGSLTIDILPTGSQSTQQQSQGGGGFQHQSSGSGFGGDGPSLFVPASSGTGWWGHDLGSPNSTGSQNNTRYAWFGRSQRLAIEVGGTVTIYDTLDHQIGGFSQQQSGGSSLTFTSQHGTVDVRNLPVIGAEELTATPKNEAPPAFETAGKPAPLPVEVSQNEMPSAVKPAETPTRSEQPGQPTTSSDIIETLEKLAGLRDKGILSEEEFSAKKAELLARL